MANLILWSRRLAKTVIAGALGPLLLEGLGARALTEGDRWKEQDRGQEQGSPSQTHATETLLRRLEIQDSGLGTRGSGLGTRDSGLGLGARGLGTRDSG